MTICVCEANGGVLPRQVLIDTDGRPAVSDVMKNKTSSRTLPPPCSHPHHLCRKKRHQPEPVPFIGGDGGIRTHVPD